MFDTSRLRGRIIEMCRSSDAFAKMMGITPTTIARKLNGKSYFSQDEIIKAAAILNIAVNDIPQYFFVCAGE